MSNKRIEEMLREMPSDPLTRAGWFCPVCSKKRGECPHDSQARIATLTADLASARAEVAQLRAQRDEALVLLEDAMGQIGSAHHWDCSSSFAQDMWSAENEKLEQRLAFLSKLPK